MKKDDLYHLNHCVIKVVNLLNRTNIGEYYVEEVYGSTIKLLRTDLSTRQTFFLPNPSSSLMNTKVDMDGRRIRLGDKGEAFQYEYTILQREV